MTEDIVNAGKAAWQQVHRATSFDRWKTIALAVSVGRQQALRTAGVNAPHGAKYSRAFHAWLDQNGFGEMAYGLRAKCCTLAENLPSIEQWRSTLSEVKRSTLNNPGDRHQALAQDQKPEGAAPPSRHGACQQGRA
jgi:hypothetical protein